MLLYIFKLLNDYTNNYMGKLTTKPLHSISELLNVLLGPFSHESVVSDVFYLLQLTSIYLKNEFRDMHHMNSGSQTAAVYCVLLYTGAY